MALGEDLVLVLFLEEDEEEEDEDLEEFLVLRGVGERERDLERLLMVM